MEGHLGDHSTFEQRFERSILSGSQAAAHRLGRRVGPFLLRRLKEQVAADLPDKVEMAPDWVDLTDEQRDLYVPIQQRGATQVRTALHRGAKLDSTSILAILIKLKQVCVHPALITHRAQPLEGRSEKFDLVLERIDEILERGDQVVVFSQFLGALGLLQVALRKKSVPLIRLEGSVPMEERQRLVDEFNDGGSQVALCSLKAVSHGINLTAANHVIHVDRWWNPAIEDQATDRVHRIGQNKTVFVHRILVADTLEEKIAALLERKRRLSDSIVDAAAQQGLRWTREELLELLEPLR